MRQTAAALTACLVIGCARQPGPGTPAPAAADLPSLEAAVGRNPGDADLVTRLGIALYDARSFTRARDVLRSAIALRGRNIPALVYLGLSHEGLGQFDSARTTYLTAAGQERDRARRRAIESRLVLLTRQELRQAAQDAVAREAELSSRPPDPDAVAVLPFSYLGASDSLAPLGRGITHLMVTDLAKVSRLRLLERERVQALADEVALAESGRVDPATGARSGRLLRAARVVQGAFQDLPGSETLRLDATVVNATTAAVVADGDGSDRLQQLFTLEKRVLLGLLDRMGIVLSPAEQRAISERPTADLQAFLAFSRGLQAEDRGDYVAAEAAFAAALARDPNFRAARDHQAQAAQAVEAMALSPAALAGFGAGGPPSGGGDAGGGRGPLLLTSLDAILPGVAGSLLNRVGPAGAEGLVSTTPGVRPPLSEFLGSDSPTSTGMLGNVIIIIIRP